MDFGLFHPPILADLHLVLRLAEGRPHLPCHLSQKDGVVQALGNLVQAADPGQ